MSKKEDMLNDKMKKGILFILPTLGVVLACGLLFWFLFANQEGVPADAGVSGNAATTANGTGTAAQGNEAGVANTDQTTENGSASGGSYGTGSINTGNLTEQGNGYEGTPGTGNYNYGEALQKSLLFYELQRSGNLPEETRCNWRGDSALSDGSDVGLDLTGGWYDAGDNVKFNLPMSYTASMLGWSVYEDKDAYEESGQLTYALQNIKWANDYFIRCHPEDEVYYYQVGNGSTDHAWWGPAELVALHMERPSYCVTADNPGSAVCAETAASLAICSILFEGIDDEYSALCLEHAISLYSFAENTKSDAGYTMAAGFYDSWSGFYDELAWAGAWLYLATEDETYLTNAKTYYSQAGQDYDWAMCWDDVHIGAALMLARITEDATYTEAVEKHLDYWTTGTSEGERITYTPQGLAWLDSWGSLRYATTTAYVAAVYSEWEGCPSDKSQIYWDFAVSQADYALGDTGFSYQIGFGSSYPQNPHHRTAQGSYCNNMNEPAQARHTLYGALVGGPDASDGYTDEVSNYTTNEVACDYNAGFTGLLAKLYSVYHGETLVDFGAVEEITTNEIYVDGAINVDGEDFVEIKAYVYNMSAWPARVPQNLELRYFIDLTEVYEAGGSAADIEVTTNYMQAGSAAGIMVWDEENHIYYLSVDFTDAMIYPGGQEHYKKEIQVRMRNPLGVWDDSNDPSFAGLSSDISLAAGMALYENDVLIFGTEPAAGENAGQSVGTQTSGESTDNTETQTGSQASVVATASNESLSVKVDYAGMQSSATSLSGTLEITNNSDGSLALNDLEIRYYFTNEDGKDLSFACYHAAINSAQGAYSGVNGCSGTFSDWDKEQADTLCTMTFSDRVLLEEGAVLTVNFCINHSDWSAFTTTNDYSGKTVENITIYHAGELIFGTEP